MDKAVTTEFMEGTVSDLLNIKPEVKVINNSDDWTKYQYLVLGNLNVAPGQTWKKTIFRCNCLNGCISTNRILTHSLTD